MRHLGEQVSFITVNGVEGIELHGFTLEDLAGLGCVTCSAGVGGLDALPATKVQRFGQSMPATFKAAKPVVQGGIFGKMFKSGQVAPKLVGAAGKKIDPFFLTPKTYANAAANAGKLAQASEQKANQAHKAIKASPNPMVAAKQFVAEKAKAQRARSVQSGIVTAFKQREKAASAARKGDQKTANTEAFRAQRTIQQTRAFAAKPIKAVLPPAPKPPFLNFFKQAISAKSAAAVAVPVDTGSKGKRFDRLMHTSPRGKWVSTLSGAPALGDNFLTRAWDSAKSKVTSWAGGAASSATTQVKQSAENLIFGKQDAPSTPTQAPYKDAVLRQVQNGAATYGAPGSGEMFGRSDLGTGSELRWYRNVESDGKVVITARNAKDRVAYQFVERWGDDMLNKMAIPIKSAGSPEAQIFAARCAVGLNSFQTCRQSSYTHKDAIMSNLRLYRGRTPFLVGVTESVLEPGQLPAGLVPPAEETVVQAQPAQQQAPQASGGGMAMPLAIGAALVGGALYLKSKG